MKRAFYLLVLLGFYLSELSAQSSNDSIKYIQSMPYESVYLQLNQEVFETGNEIRFRALVLQSQNLQPSDHSSVLYVNLRRKVDGAKTHEKSFAIKEGIADGQLVLMDTLQPGAYDLIAFTTASLDNQLKSLKTIMVRNKVIPDALIRTSFDQDFYRKGDDFKLEIQATSKRGEPLNDLEVKFELFDGKRRRGRSKENTNSEGKAIFESTFSEKFDQPEIQISVEYRENKEVLNLELPLKDPAELQVGFYPEGGHMVNGVLSLVALKIEGWGPEFSSSNPEIIDQTGRVVSYANVNSEGLGTFNLIPSEESTYQLRIDANGEQTFDLPEAKSFGYVLHLRKQKGNDIEIGVMQSNGIASDSLQIEVSQRGVQKWLGKFVTKNQGALIKVDDLDLGMGIASIKLFDSQNNVLAERLFFAELDKRVHVSVEYEQKNFGPKEKIDLKFIAKDEEGQPVEGVFGVSLTDEAYKPVFEKTNIMSYYLFNNELRTSTQTAELFSKDDQLEMIDLILLTAGWRAYEWEIVEELQDPILVDGIFGSIKTDELPRRFYTKSTGFKQAQSLKVASAFGMISLSIDTATATFFLPSELLSTSEGQLIFLIPENLPKTSLEVKTVLSEFSINDHQLFHQNKIALKERNWNILPQVLTDITRLDDIEVSAQQDNYGRNFGADLGFKFSTHDYVCQYGILNCRNHKTGQKPIHGEFYRYNDGRPVQYLSPTMAENKRLFVKGVSAIPDYYSPDYEVETERLLLPDFRTNLVWLTRLKTDENGEATHSFYTSDVRSIYLGNVDFHTTDGRLGVGSFQINVLK